MRKKDGYAFLRVNRVDMTRIPPKSASISDLSTLEVGNAPVASLVLHGVVGSGEHLPSGDRTLVCLVFSLKKRKCGGTGLDKVPSNLHVRYNRKSHTTELKDQAVVPDLVEGFGNV